ncbi:hypothetical protein CK203_070067 [Vitis vinifera]|uniref:Uncharacterized protein n=1 Tax=Vitis vinifera TaxID=29760 RepID=A0A438EHI3_VITVI|nr:hypothetical protein CK203_070067 [Vitis vinifera]
MLSTPFSSRIINYDPPRGFLLPKFSTYNGSSDPFDHIMHYRQLMTLDIGNDALLCKPTRNDAERSSKPPNQQRSPDHRQGEQSHPELPSLTPLTVSYEKLLPMICELSDFRWPGPIKADPAKSDHNKKCVYHKEHEHTTEQCGSLHYLVERLIKAGHLKQYICLEARGMETSRNRTSRTLKALIAPRAVINYIHGGPLDEEYDSNEIAKAATAASVHERINSVRPKLTDGVPTQ